MTSVMLSIQDGLVHRDQLDLLGVTRAGLRRRLYTGAWREVLPSVYTSSSGPLSTRRRWIAACLYAGRGATLTGRVALQIHGVRSLPADPPVRVLVPHARQVASVEFVRVHRTRRPDPYAQASPPIRICSVSRALVDAGRWCGDLAVIRAMVAEAVRDHRVTVEELRRELEQGPAAGSALMRLGLNSL